jgi:putative FmdB family regulatory protein
MPIYAYRCAACGHHKDVLQKLSDPVLTECPACHAQAFSKQLTAAGFQLKGGGWYVTDFKGGAAKPGADGAAAGGAAPASGGSTGADKPAASTGGGSSDAAPASGSADPSASPSTSSAGSCGGGCACH